MAKVSETIARQKGKSAVRRESREPGWGPHGRPGRVIALLVLLCALISGLVALDQASNAGEIRAGVSAGSVYLGGKTPEEAREVLSRRSSKTLNRIQIQGPNGNVTMPIHDLDARLDAKTTVERAHAVGRQGSLPERLAGRLRAPFDVSVPAEIRYKHDALARTTSEIEARVNRSPRDASVDISGSEVRFASSRDGYRLDAPATQDELQRAVENLSGEVEISGKILQPGITNEEAKTAAQTAREAVSAPLILTSGQRRWTISAADTGSTLVVSRHDGKLNVALDRDRLQNQMSDVYADLTLQGFRVRRYAKNLCDTEQGRTIHREASALQCHREWTFRGPPRVWGSDHGCGAGSHDG